MVISPHFDDAETGCGGTIYKHLKRGDTVQWHTLISEGYRVPEDWSPNTLSIEHEYAMRELGVKDYHSYGYKVDTADVMTELRDLIFKIWHKFDPDVAYVPWRKSRHQDHRAIGDFAYQVSWRTHADVLAYAIVNDFAGFTPTVFSPIDDDAFIVKINALAQYKSQFVLRSWFSLNLVVAFMKTYAAFVNGDIQYAEPFEQVKRVIP